MPFGLRAKASVMREPAQPQAPRADPDAGRAESRPRRPVEAFLAAVREALDAAPPGAREILLLTHRSPDPDAIGACVGIRRLLEERVGCPVVIATFGKIHRAENLAMVRALDLDFVDYSEIDRSRMAGLVLVDTQPEFGHTVVPENIPVVAVFDHHVPPKKGNGKKSQDKDAKRGTDGSTAQDVEPIAVHHRDVRLGVGATCSIIYEYLRDAGVPLEQHVATALFCGIRYDTADLSRNASETDEEAYYETFRRANREILPQIQHPPLPRIYYAELARALREVRQHGPLVIALLGRISHPEFVAEMADFFLRMKGVSWVVVGGAVEEELEYVLSLRTDHAFGSAYPLMERVLGGMGSFGGHGHIAGGRISLEDFGESTIKSVERKLRANALAVLGNDEEGEIPSEGRPLV